MNSALQKVIAKFGHRMPEIIKKATPLAIAAAPYAAAAAAGVAIGYGGTVLVANLASDAVRMVEICTARKV